MGSHRRINLRYVFLILMIVSFVVMFFPVRWTGPTEKFCQTWLGPPARLSILAAQGLTHSTAINNNQLTDEHLLRIFTAISAQLNQLQKQNQELLRLRKIISYKPMLVPARVIGFDSLGLASIEIDRGTFANVKTNLPVLTAIPRTLIGTANIDPKIILAGGTLIGTIAYEPGPYTARVKLMSAYDRKFTAFVVRFENNRTKTIARIRLEGSKDGKKMIADMVPIKHKVKVGDFVIPEEYKKFFLPTPMVIGTVTAINIRTDNRLLADLTIQPIIPKTALDRVYVLIPGTGE